MQSNRLTKLKAILKNKNLDALLVTEPLNTYYISGFKAERSSLLLCLNDNFIITDFRYRQEAEAIGNFKTKLAEGGFKNTLKNCLKDLGLRRLGFEAGHLSYSAANNLKTFLKKHRIGFEPLGGIVEELRLYKDPTELREIKMAVGIAKKVIARLKGHLRPGITERRLSIILDNLIRDCGAEGNAFETIIASGNNSSRPHASVTDKLLRKEEHVLIDFGVRINSYNCDLTRVFFLDRIQRRIKKIYDICIEAQARAIKRIRPGIRAEAVDRAGRGYIASKGFAEYFGHAIGHGVGLAVHELPHIAPKDNKVLKPGMVFTIEPGIYLEGAGGIRIEDMVVVTKEGCEVLTDDIPK